jgi:hypothetical protein
MLSALIMVWVQAETGPLTTERCVPSGYPALGTLNGRTYRFRVEQKFIGGVVLHSVQETKKRTPGTGPIQTTNNHIVTSTRSQQNSCLRALTVPASVSSTGGRGKKNYTGIISHGVMITLKLDFLRSCSSVIMTIGRVQSHVITSGENEGGAAAEPDEQESGALSDTDADES